MLAAKMISYGGRLYAYDDAPFPLADVGDYVDAGEYDAIVVRPPATYYHIYNDADGNRVVNRGVGPTVELAPVDFAGTLFAPASSISLVTDAD